MTRVRDIRRALVDEYLRLRRDGLLDGRMVELVGTSFEADEPGILRPPNEEYIARELKWYLSHSLYVDDIPGEVPKIWRDVASRTGRINSNYGYLVFSPGNGRQYARVLDKLRADPLSRQGVMIYTRPTMHDDSTRDGMRDFVCTNAVNYFVRDGRLHAVVQMRSNDAVFGYPNDLAWQRYVLASLADDLGVARGTITWQAASFHVYPRHHGLLEELADAS